MVRGAGGREGVSADAELVAGRYGEGDAGLPRLNQRTADYAGRWRDSQPECGSAAVDGLVPVRAAGEVLHGCAESGEASGEAGCGDLPREYGGYLCGHRVPRRNAQGCKVYLVRKRGDVEGNEEEGSARLRRRREADFHHRFEAPGASGDPVCAG